MKPWQALHLTLLALNVAGALAGFGVAFLIRGLHDDDLGITLVATIGLGGVVAAGIRLIRLAAWIYRKSLDERI